jgi:cysteinyl-tRNA synthetase
MEQIRFYNTLTRQKEDFTPLEEGKAKVYTCGPTVYNYGHIGNMRAYVFADILRRVLEYAGYDLTHVMNITDVGHLVSDGDEGEDKMEVGKKREGMDAWGIAEKYTQAFFEHCEMLHIKRPHHTPKATDHIAEQIEMIKTLEEKGYAYKTEDGIYFNTTKFDDYAKLGLLDIDGLSEGFRIKAGGKKNKTDFALWKFSTKEEQRDMEWDSPWGVGFPGWHIECSAMSMKYLGEQFDIHTGGIDHIQIHHTNEIAQSECCTGKKPFVTYWLHNEFLNLSGLKMSKSKGDILTVQTLVEKGYDPLCYRYLLLTSHYRNPLKFSWGSMDKAMVTHEKMKNKVVELKKITEPAQAYSDYTQGYLDRFMDSLFDDMNTAIAIAELHQLLKDDRVPDEEKLALVYEFDSILDIGLADAERLEVSIPDDILDLVNARNKAKADKDFAKADEYREKIEKNGFIVKDSRDGTTVEKA